MGYGSGVAVSCGVGLKTQLGSCVAVAVAVASGCSSDLTPRLGTSIGSGYSSRKQTNIHTKTKTQAERILYNHGSDSDR